MNKEYSKSCSYLFYRYYSEEGIRAAKFRMGCPLTHLRRAQLRKYKLFKKYSWLKHKLRIK